MSGKSSNNIDIKSEIIKRITKIYWMVFAFIIIVIIRILLLQNVNPEKWEEKSKSIDEKIIYANRGNICARDGRVMATSIPYYTIHFDTQANKITDSVFNHNVDSLALCLSKLFQDGTKADYKKKLIKARKEKNKYYEIKSKVNFGQLKKLRTFPIFRMGRFDGGLIYDSENRRFMPHFNLAKRTIGYLSKGEKGNIVGLEGAYNEVLAGTNGWKLMKRTSSGDWTPVYMENQVEPEDGMDIITTIDVNLQDVAEKSLERQLIKHNARHGTVILMEVQTGEILAIVNLTRRDTGIYVEDFNYAIAEKTEPGSVFKLPVLMVALEKGAIDISDSINTGNGIWKLADITIRDTKDGGYGKISVKQVFEYSSNVGMAKMIHGIYSKRPEEFIDRLFSFRLNEKLGIEIKGEENPFIKYPGDHQWSGVTVAQMAYGYEVKYTPLQILAFYNAVANSGRMVKPKFVRAFRQYGEIVKVFDTQVLNPSICSNETILKVRKLLEGVVENGTAKNLKNTLYKIAGKTGTAQIAKDSLGYQYENKKSYQASFVGYFPADKPKYSCIVVINTPTNESYYGNVVAGPVFKEIADKLFTLDYDMQKNKNFELHLTKDKNDIPYSKAGFLGQLDYVFKTLGIPVESKGKITSKWISTRAKEGSVEFNNQAVNKGLVPNVIGMGLRDAIFILENAGLKVNAKGRGSVVKQSLDCGKRINKGETISLELI